jgi:hypothetical protein
MGTCGRAVGWGTALEAGRSRVRFPMVSLEFFYGHNHFGRTKALGLIQALTNEFCLFIVDVRGASRK